ncbi:MAG: 4-(cytidine 5'-diphospho)-2-C-methyl-D-erythritol kinase [Betaproteobacteria bacterium]|nr:4-(cytidine 5'-diphospho)-2-C-methyl-D-erythritol kinase [Betaproteobacteria bacterium]
MTTVVVPAPAKLNLFLHVLGRREDGYHRLESLFRLIDFGDTITLRLRNDGKIVRQNGVPGVPEEKDLCVRAAHLLQQAGGMRLGVEIALEKRLPMGGGLGGGSSDAASILIALNRLWGLDWQRERLQQLALQLGADVPFFIFGENAFAQGIGEQLQAVNLRPAWYVVLIPSCELSTARVFKHEQLTRDSKSIRISDFLDEVSQDSPSDAWSGNTGLIVEHAPVGGSIQKSWRADEVNYVSEKWIAANTKNDLQAVACLECTDVMDHLTWLGRFSPARMTGSGVCVFAELSNEADARQILSTMPKGMRGVVARGLERHPLYDWVS